MVIRFIVKKMLAENFYVLCKLLFILVSLLLKLMNNVPLFPIKKHAPSNPRVRHFIRV